MTSSLSGSQFADAFLDANKRKGWASERSWQESIFQGQCSNADALQLRYSTHDVKGVAVTMIGIGNHWQLGDPTDTPCLLNKFAQRDQRDIGGTEHMQRGNGTAKDTDLKAEIGSYTG
ncbi:hypothetical protein D3C81_1472520 [compost metagenome]